MTELPEWQGKLGAVWAQNAGALDRMLSPVGDVGLDALGSVAGQFVVDIGCGAGACSVDLAGRGARVLGVDLSADLLEVARGRSRGLDVAYHCGDVVALARGGGLTGAEALFSRCGTMFFEDQAAAWDGILSGLGKSHKKPPCKIVLVAWASVAENDWARLPLALAEPVLGRELTRLPDSGVAGPFGWAEEQHFVPILQKSGIRNLTWRKVKRDTVCCLGQDKQGGGIAGGVEFLLRLGLLASRLHGVAPDKREQVARVLTDGLGDSVIDNQLTLSSTAWIIEGDY
ncbi:MAG: methyltransferase domain-containing protein [Proteobacteria bacterium]|nr:methyltransferase domain-containing protein [Pseudomonadota bacterium]